MACSFSDSLDPSRLAGRLSSQARYSSSRPAFKTANFREGVEKLEDLKPGMVLEGVVTNVAAFGAFVRCGGPPGRVGAHLRDGQCLRQRPAHNCEARRCRPCQGVGSRPKTPPDLADAAAR